MLRIWWSSGEFRVHGPLFEDLRKCIPHELIIVCGHFLVPEWISLLSDLSHGTGEKERQLECLVHIPRKIHQINASLPHCDYVLCYVVSSHWIWSALEAESRN